MADRPCGGCEGRGAHWRWCPNWVGRSASRLGTQGDAAEALGDSVGPNHMGASNALWAAAAMLHEEANARAREWRAGQPPGQNSGGEESTHG